MNNPEEISNTFFIHSFIAISTLILILGSIFAISSIRTVANIVSSGSTSQSPIIIVIGIVCLALMPYCFRIFKSLQILEIIENRLLLHPPVFVNDMNNPSDIELSQIKKISRDNIFDSLVEITFVEDGAKKKVYSFIKKGKTDLLKETIV